MSECRIIEKGRVEALRSVFASEGNSGLASRYKAIGDPTRLGVYLVLLQEELCVCQVEEVTGLPQSTVSGILKILLNAGLIMGRRDGRWIYYRARESVVEMKVGEMRE
ncbi:MAG: metalloregulator ArsR/SmtB family transcription factor [Candidatus Thermoplasmatota archaeon]|jgi:DNA-binding transcriptional ArsR family regulator|nr:metalloregulator ArsR/SmtB family transcription factor [Candidatus Thermoplasmatota archaeon]